MRASLSDPTQPRAHPPRAILSLAILVSALILFAGAPGFADTFTVNATGDDGDNVPGDGFCFTGLFTQTGPGSFSAACTLRAAIQEANALAGADVIEFASTLPKVANIVEIRPETALPWIREALTIDGYSADGYDLNDPLQKPIINLSGNLIPVPANGGVSGLIISGGSDIRIQGLAIFDFTGNGISISSLTSTPQDITIEGCEIGIWRGVFYRGNGFNGISVSSANNVTIGRTCTSSSCSGQRNVIASNGESGIRLVSSNYVDIAGNLIGTDKSGTSTFVSFGGATPNGEWGIEATGGGRNRIGQAPSGGGNLISGNIEGGIYIDETLDVVVNNKIGTNLAGTSALPNTGSGIELARGPNTVGFSGRGRNIISGNSGSGIYSIGNNAIVGNVIGLSADESTPIGNAGG